jgi:hemolysin activation/secretion protein
MNCYLQYSLIGLPISLILVGNIALAGEQLTQLKTTVNSIPKTLLSQSPQNQPQFKIKPEKTDSFSILSFTEFPLVQNDSLENSEEILIESCPEIEKELSQAQSVQIWINAQGKVIKNESTVLESQAIEKNIQPILQQKRLSQPELETALANTITLQYLEQGFITSRAEVLPSNTEPIIIQVIEGTITEIQIVGRDRFNQSYICERLLLGITTPFNTLQLEDQLRLFRSDPLLTNIEASLRPTGNSGESLLRVKVEEAQPFALGFSFDNYSPPSIGSEQLGVGLSYLNVTGIGDILTASYQHSTTGGADILDVSYQLPLNARNGTLQLRVAPYWTEITQPPFDQLDIQGQTDRYELSYRQPLIRSIREELALSLGFAYQDGQTFVFEDRPFPFGFGPDEEGVSRTSVFKFAQEYIHRNPKGSWLLRSEFGLGTGLFDATENPGSIPDGQFFKWLAQAQRVQQLDQNLLLILQAELQLSADSLLPSQQFILGGGQSLRGFRQNARSGDNGFRLSIENRWTVARNSAGSALIQIAPFLDMGAVWNIDNNPNQIPEENVIAGAGLGFLWRDILGMNGLSLRLDYSLPLVEIEDRGNNIQDDGLYFKINYQPRF